MNNEKETTSVTNTKFTKFANAIGIFCVFLGIIFVITNLIGVTDLAWLRVCAILVPAFAIFVSNKRK